MGAFSRHQMGECSILLRKVEMGSLLPKDEEQLPSFCIAVKDQAFGEGAERIVRKGTQIVFSGVSCVISYLFRYFSLTNI